MKPGGGTPAYLLKERAPNTRTNQEKVQKISLVVVGSPVKSKQKSQQQVNNKLTTSQQQVNNKSTTSQQQVNNK